MPNCVCPDITDLRCWLCPHNPYTRSLPILGVHAALLPQQEEEDEDDWPEDDWEDDDEDWDEDDDWDEDAEDEEDDDDPTDYLPHMNQTLESSLLPEVRHVGDSLDDLLALIFDLYKVFPYRKDVLSDMEDTVCQMIDLHDELLDLVEAYNYEVEED